MDKIAEIFRSLPDLIKQYWTVVMETPMFLWKWAQDKPVYKTTCIIVGILIALLSIYILISFFRVDWKGKIRTLFVTAFTFLALCALLLWARHEVSGFILPKAETTQINGETVEVYRQYSLLCHQPNHGTWALKDPVTTVEVNNDLILQISGLDTLYDNERYYIESIQHTDDQLSVGFYRQCLTYPDKNMSRMDDFYMKLTVIPASKLSKMVINADEGESVSGRDLWFDYMEEHYIILENTGDEVVFIARSNIMDMYYAGIARQIGADVVIGLSRGYVSESLDNPKNPEYKHYIYDPFSNEYMRTALLLPLKNLFSGNILLLSGLKKEEKAALLPEYIADFPTGTEIYKYGSFRFPCDRLIEMTDQSIEAAENPGEHIIRFIGDGPDGLKYVYSLTHGGAQVWFDKNNNRDQSWYDSWERTFKAGVEDPDHTISDFIGTPAVPFSDGWLIDAGPLFDYQTPYHAYYYLTMELAEEQ